MKNKLTVFTPTYNRAYLLPNLYSALCKQSNKNFNWLIVDDGSNDETSLIVKKWQSEKVINIEYYKKENGGKHTAIDFANEKCNTDYIVCVDSDDLLIENAINEILTDIKNIENLDNCVGLVYPDLNKSMEFNSDKFPKGKKLILFEDLNKKFGYNVDTLLVFKLDIVKQYKFPKIADEKFITEAVYYNQFLKKYKVLTKNKGLQIIDYQQDGYTVQGLDLFFKNAKGFLFYLKQSACLEKSLKSKIGMAARYYAWKSINKIKDIFPQDYKINCIIKFIGRILSYIPYKKYKKEYNKFINKKDNR